MPSFEDEQTWKLEIASMCIHVLPVIVSTSKREDKYLYTSQAMDPGNCNLLSSTLDGQIITTYA